MRSRERVAGYLFTAPMTLGYLLIVVYPLAMVIWYSVQEYHVLGGTFDFVGLDNYRHLLEDPRLRTVLMATVFFVAGLVPSGVILALFLAVLVNQRVRGVRIFRAIFFSPSLVSLAAWAIVWEFMLNPNGPVNGLLRVVAIDGPNWLREPVPAMASVIVVQLFKNVGINMLIFLAALQIVPKELTEAARVDGASRWVTFRKVTLPIISPQVLMVAMLMLISSFQVFAQILLLTEGGPGYETTVLPYYIYQQAFQQDNFGYASTLSMLLFVIILGATALMWRVRKKVVFYESD